MLPKSILPLFLLCSVGIAAAYSPVFVFGGSGWVSMQFNLSCFPETLSNYISHREALPALSLISSEQFLGLVYVENAMNVIFVEKNVSKSYLVTSRKIMNFIPREHQKTSWTVLLQLEKHVSPDWNQLKTRLTTDKLIVPSRPSRRTPETAKSWTPTAKANSLLQLTSLLTPVSSSTCSEKFKLMVSLIKQSCDLD